MHVAEALGIQVQLRVSLSKRTVAAGPRLVGLCAGSPVSDTEDVCLCLQLEVRSFEKGDNEKYAKIPLGPASRTP